MPKGNLNPADAYRKAQRKKELKKNKADRAKARDFALVKKDTTGMSLPFFMLLLSDCLTELEEEINQLESTNGDKTRLAQLKTELEKITKKKEEYVKEHPEQRNLVYRRHRKHADDNTTAQPDEPVPQKRNLFNKKGLPRHPERSLYYDPVLNPFGVPPPGMPYLERPLRPDEVDSDAGNTDVPLLSAPPAGYELVESDDEIFLPEGPPPSPMQPPPLTQPSFHPPPGFPIGNLTPSSSSILPIVHPMVPPPPIPGFLPGAVMFPPPGVPFYPHPSLPSPAHLPPVPPGFFPRNQSVSAIQDPLSSIPHTTYQAHRVDQYASHSMLPSNPSPKPTAVAELANATVVAAPQLRDFQKEATAFLPKSLMKKKPGSATTVNSQVNAAPPLELAVSGNKEQDKETGSPAASARPDLVGALKSQFSAARTFFRQSSDVKKGEAKKNDDYEKFMDEMSDII